MLLGIPMLLGSLVVLTVQQTRGVLVPTVTLIIATIIVANLAADVAAAMADPRLREQS